jgi:DNA-binding transcriptional ArsR family regulator
MSVAEGTVGLELPDLSYRLYVALRLAAESVALVRLAAWVGARYDEAEAAVVELLARGLVRGHVGKLRVALRIPVRPAGDHRRRRRAPVQARRPHADVADPRPNHRIDETDHAILAWLENHDDARLCELTQALKLTKSNLSRRLATLRARGLVLAREVGAGFSVSFRVAP